MTAKETSLHPAQHEPLTPYETRDANFRNLMFAGLGLMGLIVFALVATWLISDLLTRDSANPGATASTITTARPEFPAPQLQADPLLDLSKVRAHEDSVLSTYGWSDRKAGLVRVPIEQAMTLLLQKGLPVVTSQDQMPQGRHARIRFGKESR